jgi:hypothetical protein
MRKIASHHIFRKQLYHLHYIELGDDGVFLGIHPLQEETAATEFYDGLLVVVPAGTPLPHPFTPEQLRQSGITDSVSAGDRVHLYRIHGEVIYRCL